LVDVQPVLQQHDTGHHQRPLEPRCHLEERLVLLVGAEAHDVLHPGAVVPAAIEQDELACGRQMGDVALQVVLAPLAVGRGAERHDASHARAQATRDALDDAALAGRVAALEHDHDLEPTLPDPFLELDQLELELAEGRLERLAPHGPSGRLGRPSHGHVRGRRARTVRRRARAVCRHAALARAAVTTPLASVTLGILLPHVVLPVPCAQGAIRAVSTS